MCNRFPYFRALHPCHVQPVLYVPLSMACIVALLTAGQVFAEEQQATVPDHKTPSATQPSTKLVQPFSFDWSGFSAGAIPSRIESPPHARVSRSYHPLRRVTLVGGDYFLGECLNWGTVIASFRLLSGQIVHLPVATVAKLANPPGEVDLLDESFEEDSSSHLEPGILKQLDEAEAADGHRSLKFDSASSDYRQSFSPDLSSARIEFSFKIAANDISSGCGEWQIEWSNKKSQYPPLVVRIGPDRRIDSTDVPSGRDTETQSLAVTEGWHSFVALITQEQTRLIVDDAILASFATQDRLVQAIRFQSAGTESKNSLWIDALHVRMIDPLIIRNQPESDPIDTDAVCFATGDEVFGKLQTVGRTAASIEAFGQQQSIPWNKLIELDWRQPAIQIVQEVPPKTGIVAQIEMQSFVDRRECEPECWTVTLIRVDAKQVVAQHSLAGELIFQWSEIRRLTPLFFGQTILVDARRFHLGNSIRPDLHRHLPDGTELREQFRLSEIPQSQAFLSVDVAELEASGTNAPLSSPFLAELRAGRLITELFINDERIGELNSQIRFKATAKNPERIRLEIPSKILKVGDNTLRLRQQPLKPGGREFDDCEVGPLRLEFEIR